MNAACPTSRCAVSILFPGRLQHPPAGNHRQADDEPANLVHVRSPRALRHLAHRTNRETPDEGLPPWVESFILMYGLSR